MTSLLQVSEGLMETAGTQLLSRLSIPHAAHIFTLERSWSSSQPSFCPFANTAHDQDVLQVQGQGTQLGTPAPLPQHGVQPAR